MHDTQQVSIDDEPFSVHADYDSLKVIVTAKNSFDRDLIHKKLKWYTVIFRKIKKDADDDSVCFIQCKTVKELERKLCVFLVTMQMLRGKQKK